MSTDTSKPYMLSEMGKDFDGRPLDEDTLNAGVDVVWKNQLYTTGNRHHSFVELWSGKKFKRTIKADCIQLIKSNQP
jgi:hypothetical protein